MQIKYSKRPKGCEVPNPERRAFQFSSCWQGERCWQRRDAALPAPLPLPCAPLGARIPSAGVRGEEHGKALPRMHRDSGRFSHIEIQRRFSGSLKLDKIGKAITPEDADQEQDQNSNGSRALR